MATVQACHEDTRQNYNTKITQPNYETNKQIDQDYESQWRLWR
jgi:hypothetical protein